MSEVEYWLLEAVVDGMRLINNLEESVVQRAFNSDGHGSSNAVIVSALNNLFIRKDIIAYSRNRVSHKERCFVPTRAELETFFPKPAWVWYGLTEQGGELWEKFSNPDWMKFMQCEVDTVTGEGTVASSNVDLLNRYIYQSNVKRSIVSGSLRYSMMENWAATYWKTLPIGYLINFEAKIPYEAFPVVSNNLAWYTNPFS